MPLIASLQPWFGVPLPPCLPTPFGLVLSWPCVAVAAATTITTKLARRMRIKTRTICIGNTWNSTMRTVFFGDFLPPALFRWPWPVFPPFSWSPLRFRPLLGPVSWPSREDRKHKKSRSNETRRSCRW